ncbi:bifunctional metallophosphatase/5'-nucleotidase [Halobacterium zhouii]|uniref:bifunctional metallophosphatase/5'-nucleotidase n=1 Tax=Halobacterium zhouii TaxID=2902624 RepID=UPI001E4F66D2|nr:5'-nucleotidase C-terminal domain-containing protein [Halobacterium zhouii]
MSSDEDTDGGSLVERFTIDRRRFLSASAGAAAVLGGAGTVSAASDPVTLIHDTHFHGRFEGQSGVNIAQYTAKIDELRNEHANAGFVGIGDDFSPSTMGFEFHGEHMVEALNYLDPVVNGVGNHEFDFGVDNASARFQNSTYPWVVANLLTPDGNPIPGTERWTIEDVGGHRVGFFGSGVEDFHSITSYPDDYQVIHPVDAAQEATTALREAGADLVVMTSHTDSSTHDDIAAEVDGLDAIVGSHSGVVQDQVREVSGTLVSEVGDQFAHLGVLQLDPETGDAVGWERHDLESQADSLPEDAGMRSIMDEWLGKLDDRLGQTVFRTSRELDARFNTNYAVESNMGNLICDVMREEMDADIALQNPGGIRSNDTYGPGPITGKDVYNILPFPNKVTKVEVEGRKLVESLAISVAALPWSWYGIQGGSQVAGLQYEFTGTGESAVGNFYVNGERLDPDATYTLATNDYIYNNYDEINAGTLLDKSEDFLGTIFIDHLSEWGVVDPDTDNRILRVDESAGDASVSVDGDTVTASFPLPEQAAGVYGKTFRAVNAHGQETEAAGVSVSGGSVRVTFDYQDLENLASGPKHPDVRVLGGFDPDESVYDYGMDLPVASPAYYFTVKARVPVNGRGPNPFGGTGNGRGPDEYVSDEGTGRRRHSHEHGH